MKANSKTGMTLLTLAGLFLATVALMAQQPAIQNFRPNDQSGLNVFETLKDNETHFEGLKIRLGGAFAMQFQGLNQSNDTTTSADQLVDLGKNFNLPTANMYIDGQLYDGVRVHLGLYLSSLHHQETWVKGGYLQIDKLDFIKPGFLEGFMKVATIRMGLDEVNFGDAHFRRSDNARAIYNPFVGNYLMDAFTTEAFGEVNVQSNGLYRCAGHQQWQTQPKCDCDAHQRQQGVFLWQSWLRQANL